MSNSKNYLWQKRWIVRMDECSCTHDSGLEVEWTTSHFGAAVSDAITHDHSGRPWYGSIVGGADAIDAWLALQPSIRDANSKITRVKRILREAREAWESALAGTWRAHRRPPGPRVGEIGTDGPS